MIRIVARASLDGSGRAPAAQAGWGRPFRFPASVRRTAAALSVALAIAPAIPNAQVVPAPPRPAALPLPSGSISANLPRLGDAGGDELSPQAERRLGESVMRDVRRDPDWLDDPEVDDWLGAFGQRLVGAVPGGVDGREFEFFTMRDRTLNAFALPGGFIGVHSGLVLAAGSESELASVLGHEIGHVTQRHIARMLARERQATPVAIAALAVAILAARSSPNAAMGLGTLGDTVARSNMLSFSRDAEREADRIGFEILRNAGFDPTASATFFGRLQLAGRVYDSPAAPAYLRSHPLTTERIADMQARTLGTSPQAPKPEPIDFAMVRARLRVMQDPRVDGVRAARTYFERALADRAMPAAAAWYGLALAAAALRDADGVERGIARARAEMPGGHPSLDRLEIDARADAGDAAGAAVLARTARGRWPASRALAHAEARALMAAGRTAEAAERLRIDAATWRGDARLWERLSQAQGALGQRALAHHAAAEAAVQRGAWQVAFEQLRLAQRAGDADFIAASMIDARLRAVQVEALREREESGRGGR